MTSMPPQPLPLVPDADQIVPITREILAQILYLRKKILATVTADTATFANVIKPHAEFRNRYQAKLGMIWNLGYASPDEKVHDEVDKAKELIRKSREEWMPEEPWFRLIKAVAEKDEPLDPEDKLWVMRELSDLSRCGHGILSQEQIEVYLKGQSEIGAIEEQFARNMRADNSGLWFNLEDLDGVPVTYLDSWMSDNTSPDKKFVPFTDSNIIVSYANKVETRKQMYLAWSKIVPDNVALFQNVIIRRDAQARMLGYANHGAFRVEHRSVKSVEWIKRFLKSFGRTSFPVAAKNCAFSKNGGESIYKTKV